MSKLKNPTADLSTLFMQLFMVSRFGAQARDDVSVVEKCIIATVKIINDRGQEVSSRPTTEKY